MTLEQVQQDREPADILRDEAIKKLQQIFPDKNVDSVVGSFLIDVLHRRGMPSSLDRMLPEKQKEFLCAKGETLEVAIHTILDDIPEDLIDFYHKKLDSGVKKNFDLL